MRNRAALLAAMLLPLPAAAHVTLSEPSAPPGADYVADFQVGHGCDGSPTTSLTIAIPLAILDVRPADKPGWKLSVSHQGVITNVRWRDGSLPAGQRGQFRIAMRLPMKTQRIIFKAIQTCVKGEEIWSELPADDGHHLDHPAPVLTVGATPADGMQTVAMTKADMEMAQNNMANMKMPQQKMDGMAMKAGPSSLSLSQGWIRLLPGNLPAAGYFTLKNSGKSRIALTGADTPACGMLMLHKSDDKGGMSSMEDVQQVDVPAGGSLAFAPGGYHLMCMDPKPALKLGASVPVTLSFQGAPPLTARFDVRSATGK